MLAAIDSMLFLLFGQDCVLTTPQKPGDTVDNDCDGEVDEDDCDTPNPTGELSWQIRVPMAIADRHALQPTV